MIRTVIIEDEKYAGLFLKELLGRIAADIEVVAMLDNVQDAIRQLPSLDPDLILADIQLGDGVSFSIFESIQWKKPVIFITAYDKYAIHAFKVNGIDYLLKPYDEGELILALDKYRNMWSGYSYSGLHELVKMLSGQNREPLKERFAVTLGSRILSIPVQEISYFFFHNKITYLVREDGQKFPYTESLDKLYSLVNPGMFFRINRNYLIQHRAIERMEHHAGRNIVVYLNPLPQEGSVSVSKDRITEFKYWLDK